MHGRINVLQTTVGGLTSPGIIDAIKRNGEREVRLVGTDVFPDIRGAYQVDKFYKVPDSGISEDAFVESILSIVKDEAIDVIMPCGNEDCLALSKKMEAVEALGAKVAISPYDRLLAGFDKGETYRILNEHVPEAAPRYQIVSDYDAFRKAAEDIGYPAKKIVVKPRHGRGGRGVMVLDPDVSLKGLLSSKADINYSFDYVDALLKRAGRFPELIVMEYLSGKYYSVYSLCDNGRQILSVPNIRLWGTPSQTLRGIVDLNEDVIRSAGKIIKAFGFSYTINYEAAESDDGRVVVYDINPRLAASTAYLRAAGANIIYLAIKLALGEPFDVPHVENGVMMVRYFQEMYLKEGRVIEC